MTQGRKLARRVLGLTMSTMLTVTGCGPEGLAPEEQEQQPTQESATAAVPEQDSQVAAKQQVDALLPPGCDENGCPDDPPPDDDGGPSYPYYTLFWRANLLKLRCLTTSDWDGRDEAWLESEVTGDHDADVIWGVSNMEPGWVANFNPLNPWPPPLQFTSHSFGAGAKLVALWDESTGPFDVEEQIGWTTLTALQGTRTTLIEGNGGKYELTYSVEYTGCSPISAPCPTYP